MSVEPEEGTVAIMYPPAVFPSCPVHGQAGAAVIREIEFYEGGTAIRFHDPVCPKCGAELLAGYGYADLTDFLAGYQ